MAQAKGTKQLGVGIDERLADEFKTFCESRGETIRAAVEAALRRHMDNPPPMVPPPPPVYPPLPPVTATEVKKSAPKRKK